MENKEIIAYISVGIIILLLIFSTFGMLNFNRAKANTNGDSVNMPEECKVPQGQDIEAWKEHLGHHENTKYCLEYYK